MAHGATRVSTACPSSTETIWLKKLYERLGLKLPSTTHYSPEHHTKKQYVLLHYREREALGGLLVPTSLSTALAAASSPSASSSVALITLVSIGIVTTALSALLFFRCAMYEDCQLIAFTGFSAPRLHWLKCAPNPACSARATANDRSPNSSLNTRCPGDLTRWFVLGSLQDLNLLGSTNRVPTKSAVMNAHHVVAAAWGGRPSAAAHHCSGLSVGRGYRSWTFGPSSAPRVSAACFDSCLKTRVSSACFYTAPTCAECSIGNVVDFSIRSTRVCSEFNCSCCCCCVAFKSPSPFAIAPRACAFALRDPPFWVSRLHRCT